MAEEVKETKEPEKTDTDKVFKTILKVLLGVVLLAVGVVLLWVWKKDLFALIRGCVGLFLILAGVITLAIGTE